jgi:hypothetical protein
LCTVMVLHVSRLYLFCSCKSSSVTSVHIIARVATVRVSVYVTFYPLRSVLLINLYLCNFLRYRNFTIYFEGYFRVVWCFRQRTNDSIWTTCLCSPSCILLTDALRNLQHVPRLPKNYS